jgi:hypothetical protein
MQASVRQNPDGTVTIQTTFGPGSSMMECESRILEAVNQTGNLATAHCLQSFDGCDLALM